MTLSAITAGRLGITHGNALRTVKPRRSQALSQALRIAEARETRVT